MAFTNTIGGAADDSVIKTITLIREADGTVVPEVTYDCAGQKKRHGWTPTADFKTKVETLYTEIKNELDAAEGVE